MFLAGLRPFDAHSTFSESEVRAMRSLPRLPLLLLVCITAMSAPVFGAVEGINAYFKGYTGGQRDGVGSILIETDAVTREREAAEKARQDAKQQL
jgi:hypothetical protein